MTHHYNSYEWNSRPLPNHMLTSKTTNPYGTSNQVGWACIIGLIQANGNQQTKNVTETSKHVRSNRPEDELKLRINLWVTVRRYLIPTVQRSLPESTALILKTELSSTSPWSVRDLNVFDHMLCIMIRCYWRTPRNFFFFRTRNSFY